MSLIEKNQSLKEQMSDELDQKSEYARNLHSNHQKDLMLEKEKNEALQMQNSRLKQELTEKDQQVQTKNSELERKTEEIETKNSELERKKEEIETKNSELERKTEEVESLREQL